jgi:hypothetical protein
MLYPNIRHLHLPCNVMASHGSLQNFLVGKVPSSEFGLSFKEQKNI